MAKLPGRITRIHASTGDRVAGASTVRGIDELRHLTPGKGVVEAGMDGVGAGLACQI
jgi:hypothetical protein